MDIPHARATDSANLIVEHLSASGCVVIHDLADADTRTAFTAELESSMAAAEVRSDDDPEAFYPGQTRRVTALIRKSATCRDLVMHPLVMQTCDALLGPHCERYQLHVASALNVGPGARAQVLHREDDVYPFFPLPRPNLVLASMWAITDFTAENGATCLVPGSHLWPEGRSATPEEVRSAAMPAGATLLWLGGTLHGAGHNRSSGWRYGVFLSYSLGWLRQEENQYVDVPIEFARTLPRPLRDLVGYKMHDGLGFYEN